MNNDQRTALQINASEELFLYKRLLASWGTSTGKTNICVFFIDKLLDRNPDANILLLVAEKSHKLNWYKEFVKFLGEERTNIVYKHLTVECYASLKKYPNTSWTFICADEVHHLFSDIRINIFRTVKTEYFLGLSATVTKDQRAELEYILGSVRLSKLSLQDSIDKGFVAEPTYKLIPLTLSTLPNTTSFKMVWGKKERRRAYECSFEDRWTYIRNKLRYKDVELTVYCSERQKYDYLNEQFEYSKNAYFTNPGNDRLKNIWLQYGSQRKRFLGELKTEKVKSLINTLRDNNQRILCFCTSIAQAVELGGETSVHSNNSKSLKTVERFNNGEINELYAVSMLTEGVSLKNIDCEVLVQLDGADRLFLQKSGRALRAEEPVIYIFYYRNTRDEEFLTKALSQINKEYISYASI